MTNSAMPAFQPNPAVVCPPWCTHGHDGEPIVIEGDWTLGVVHEQILAELPAQDPGLIHGDATVTVMVESSSEDGQAINAPRLLVTIAEGHKGGYVGSAGVQGWSGTPAQARALAAALVAGAGLLDLDAFTAHTLRAVA